MLLQTFRVLRLTLIPQSNNFPLHFKSPNAVMGSCSWKEGNLLRIAMIQCPSLSLLTHFRHFPLKLLCRTLVALGPKLVLLDNSNPVLGVLVFLPRSWIILDNLEFLAKILDFLDFLPKSWQLILPRNPRKIKILPRNPRSCQSKSEKEITVVFINMN